MITRRLSDRLIVPVFAAGATVTKSPMRTCPFAVGARSKQGRIGERINSTQDSISDWMGKGAQVRIHQHIAEACLRIGIYDQDRFVHASSLTFQQSLMPRLTYQPLRNLRDRIPPFHDLMHRIPLEVVTEFGVTHDGLFASNLGNKVSTNLGAIHCLDRSYGEALSSTVTVFNAFLIQMNHALTKSAIDLVASLLLQQ